MRQEDTTIHELCCWPPNSPRGTKDHQVHASQFFSRTSMPSMSTGEGEARGNRSVGVVKNGAICWSLAGVSEMGMND